MPGLPILQTLLLLFVLAFSGGCESLMWQEMGRTDPWGNWAQRTGGRKSSGQGGGVDASAFAQAQAGWAIELDTFESDSRQKLARRLTEHLKSSTNISDIWYRDHAGVATVYRGRYLSPELPEAKRDLQQTRLIVVDGWRPFKAVKMVQLTSDAPKNDRDLRGYPGMYTLQIAFYTPEYSRDYKAAAERYVDELRKKKLDAFFYHGPNMTNVTIGLFTQEEAYTAVGKIYQHSEAVQALTKQFPYNMGNGVKVPMKDKRGNRAFQTSKLVIVPGL